MNQTRRNPLTIVLFSVYFLLLTGVIIFKLPFYSPMLSDGVRVLNLIPFAGSFDESDALLLREIVYNVLLFVPLGVYLCMLMRGAGGFRRRALVILGVSLAFEVIQYIFAMGRSDVTDLINNTLGGVIGIAVYAMLFKLLKARTDTVINVLALAVTVIAAARFGQLFFMSHFSMIRPR